jgi:adenosylmethionine-8-amino-7-oxononanoate aminotransferase
MTFGGLTVTGLPNNQEGFGPLVGGVVSVPYDDLAAVDAVIAREGASRIAAIIAEPVVGAGGVLPPPDGYLQGLRARADAAGAFLVLDEVITAFGRLGRWFGANRYDVVPDLVTIAKGVTSGYQPVGGVLVGRAVRDRLEADPDFLLRHGHTYGGHPIACAAALANLDVLEQDGLVEPATAARIADGLRVPLEALVDGERVLEVRGVGGMWAAHLGPAAPDAVAVRDAMLDRGVIARHLGNDVMVFCPPLVITDDEIATAVGAFAASIR